jgi:hypothetical protein
MKQPGQGCLSKPGLLVLPACEGGPPELWTIRPNSKDIHAKWSMGFRRSKGLERTPGTDRLAAAVEMSDSYKQSMVFLK